MPKNQNFNERKIEKKKREKKETFFPFLFFLFDTLFLALVLRVAVELLILFAELFVNGIAAFLRPPSNFGHFGNGIHDEGNTN